MATNLAPLRDNVPGAPRLFLASARETAFSVSSPVRIPWRIDSFLAVRVKLYTSRTTHNDQTRVGTFGQLLRPIELYCPQTLIGHTGREANFLALAALRSGYFLRRQFETFAHLKRGRAGVEMLRKTRELGHAGVTVYANRTEVYHLFARNLYRALGDEDNRNRRARPPLSVKAKLMAFDFVLAHRSHQYLATEQDKVDHFTLSLGVDASKLPVKIYRSAGNLQTRRCFIEKYPLFLSDPTSSAPVVSFCYVDEGGAFEHRIREPVSDYAIGSTSPA